MLFKHKPFMSYLSRIVTFSWLRLQAVTSISVQNLLYYACFLLYQMVNVYRLHQKKKLFNTNMMIGLEDSVILALMLLKWLVLFSHLPNHLLYQLINHRGKHLCQLKLMLWQHRRKGKINTSIMPSLFSREFLKK